MNIRTKILLSTLSISVIVVFIGLVSIFLIQVQIEEIQQNNIRANKQFESTANIASYVKRAEGHMMLYLILKNDVDKTKFFDRYTSLKEQIQILQSTARSQNDFELIEVIQSSSDELLIYADMILEHSNSHDGLDLGDKEHEKILRNFNDAVSKIGETSIKFIEKEEILALEMARYVKKAETHLMLYLILNDPIEKKRFYNAMTGLTNETLELEKISKSAHMTNIIKWRDNLYDVSQRLIEVHDKDPQTFVINLDKELFRSINKYSSNIRDASINIITTKSLSNQIIFDESILKLVFSQQVIVLSVIVASIFSMFISIRLALSMSKPILQLKDIMQNVTSGDLNGSVNIKTNDEIEDLGKSFNNMIHSIKESQEIIKEQSEELIKSEKLSTIGEFSAMLAHDLRNPLSVIKNIVYLLKYSDDPITTKNIPPMNRAIDRIEHQINDVLTFVKNKPPTFEKHSVTDIIKKSLDLQVIPDTIKVTLSGDHTEFFVDPIQMESVFSNLIRNSIESIGDDVGEIIITVIENQNNAIIEIRDSGILNADIGEIFEPLFTTKMTGTGLGLVSCKNIVEQHGGKIIAKSNPTVFTITLPKSNE